MMLSSKCRRLCKYGLLVVLSYSCSRSANLLAQGAPDPGQADLREGIGLMQAGHFSEAKERFDRAVANMPRSASALTWRGISENQLRQYAEARADFEAALQFDATMLATHYNLALSLIRLNQIDSAIEQLKLVSAAQPNSVPPLYNLAVLLESKGLLNEAAERLSNAHNLAPADKDITLHLLMDQLKLGRANKLPPLVQDLKDKSTSPEIQQQAGHALLESGKTSEAVILLKQAHERAPEASETTVELARGLAACGDISEAVTLLHTAYSADPANITNALALARMLLATDQADEAEKVLSQMTPASGERSQQFLLMGIALAATHQITEAVVHLQKSIEEDPKLALAQDVLGFCYLQKGQYTQAAEAYGKASDLDPQQAMYARDAATAFERANRGTQALHFAERAASLSDKDAASHALLGKLYAATDRDQDAVKELLIATKLNPDLDSALYLLARTYQRLGDQEDATAWSHKLEVVKQKHEASFLSQKKEAASEIRSSTLLEGGILSADGPGAP